MTQLATDDFNRADNASLGANWTTTTSELAPQVVTNECAANTTINVGGARYTGYGAWPNDQYAECLIGSAISTTSDEGAGPACRIASAAWTHYLIQTNTTETRIYKVVGGTFTQLGTDGPACVTGDVLRLECSGTSITAKRNGTAICSSPITDSSITAGDAGLWTTRSAGGTTTINTWSAGDFASGGGGVSFVALESGIRGLNRGQYGD